MQANENAKGFSDSPIQVKLSSLAEWSGEAIIQMDVYLFKQSI